VCDFLGRGFLVCDFLVCRFLTFGNASDLLGVLCNGIVSLVNGTCHQLASRFAAHFLYETLSNEDSSEFNGCATGLFTFTGSFRGFLVVSCSFFGDLFGNFLANGLKLFHGLVLFVINELFNYFSGCAATSTQEFACGFVSSFRSELSRNCVFQMADYLFDGFASVFASGVLLVVCLLVVLRSFLSSLLGSMFDSLFRLKDNLLGRCLSVLDGVRSLFARD